MKKHSMLEVQKEIESGEVKIGDKTFKMSPQLQKAMSKSFQEHAKRILEPFYDLYKAAQENNDS